MKEKTGDHNVLATGQKGTIGAIFTSRIEKHGRSEEGKRGHRPTAGAILKGFLEGTAKGSPLRMEKPVPTKKLRKKTADSPNNNEKEIK